MELFHHTNGAHQDETPTIVEGSSIKLEFESFFETLLGFWEK